MSTAEFEEKEFEGPLNGQLGVPAPVVFAPMWSPGQVLEEVVGFDAAMMTFNMAFWAARGHYSPNLPQGAVVAANWWPSAPPNLSQRLPTFRMNVFLQYKRPEYLTRTNSNQWEKWKRSYFRFSITLHQQVALDACARALGHNGLVAYASPAFHSRKDLFTHIQRGTLLAHTHFAPAALLSGHTYYTYVDATQKGIALSEPVSVTPLTILNGGGRGDGPPDEPPSGADDLPPNELLKAARQAAEAAVDADQWLVGSKELFENAVGRAIAATQSVPEQPVEGREAIRDFIRAATFSWMSGITWTVLTITARARKSRTSA